MGNTMNPMQKKTALISLSALSATLLLTTFQQARADAIEQAFSDGKARADFRYRYEMVDDGAKLDATASTLRSRIGFTTSDAFDLSAHVDFEHVGRLGSDDYNSTQNGQTTYATVADPDSEELNQAYLKYKLSQDGTITAGRQRIIMDNARFVGNVGWRQNEQTFDGIRIKLKPAKDISIDYAYLTQVNTILGGEVDLSANLINASYSAMPGGELSAYLYSLDYDAVSKNSTNTLGVRYKGKKDKLLYTLELATQGDTGSHPGSLSANYLFGEIGYKVADKTTVFFAQETLGSDTGSGDGFQTPLATKHAFNGWADKFLGTPPLGLKDMYLKAVTTVEGVKLIAMYHDFSSYDGGASLGTELDLVAVKKINKSTKAIFKYASYDADSFSTDTQKIWLQLEIGLKQ